MRRLLYLIGALLCFCQVQSKAVFAHFMVGNVASYTASDWVYEILLADAYGIDAFALNIAFGDDTVPTSLENAFEAVAASGTNFKLFFSFDYAGGGAWPSADVDSYLGEFAGNSGYYHTDGGQPFVSTFEGPANAQDWVALKAKYNVFFMPDWSSLGAGPAWDLGVADGLFSWAAWPWGNEDSNTWVDASYLQVLKNGGNVGSPYMMGVSPMFYTNLPGYDKNWAWRGDRLWFDRWKEVLFLQPDYVEIITWNDWGESHYIAPLDSTQYDSVLSLGEAPFDYVSGFDHSSWLKLLPAFTALYKSNTTTLDSQTLVGWGRSTSVNVDCSTNGTTVNTASQLQIEFPPNQALSDYVFFVAIVTEMPPATPFVTVGGNPIGGQWSDIIGSTSDGGLILFGNATYEGYDFTGDVGIAVELSDGSALTVKGFLTDSCTDGYLNYNMWTEYDQVAASGTLSVEDYVCTAGTSVDEFSDLCEFTCALGYCPYTACICSAIGPQPKLPEPVATQCYPLASASVVYEGICHFACTYGYLDSAHCGTADVPAPTPTVSPFNPDAVTAGTGNGDNSAFDDLCEFTCQYGYCPLAACVATDTGDLVLFTGNVVDAKATFAAEPWNEPLNDLCAFSCNRGHCPDSCESDLACTSGSGDGNYAGLCDFSCGYGFCPEPCTCLSNGTRSTPPTYDATIVGYPDTGLDVDTYGPLCNFTCSHGYCPSPNACVESLSINPTIDNSTATPPTLEDYTPENATYSPGDTYVYVSNENPDLSLQVTLQGVNNQSDVPAGSLDADALADIGEATELLVITLLNDDYALSKRDVQALNDYHFVTHSHWKPSGNCTTRHCMLVAGAPSETWTSVGNGSYKGVQHELSFINTGKTLGYSVSRWSYSNSTHSKRRNGNSYGAQYVFGVGTLKHLSSMDKADFGNFDKPFQDMTAYGAIDAANMGYLTNCNVYLDNSTALDNDNTTSIAEGVISITTPQVVGAVAAGVAAIDKLAQACAAEEQTPTLYVIYPQKGTDVDSLSSLLASFQNVNLVTYNSLTTDGVLYWTANLTPLQWRKVSQEKQCLAAPAKCKSGSCPNPSADFTNVNRTATYNTTARPLTKETDPAHFTARLSERDGQIATESNAPPDLWFISQPPGSPVTSTDSPGTYTYDSTGGKNVVVYILDPGRFDMTFPEFSEWALVPGTIQIVSSITPKLFGPDGWVPTWEADGVTGHGTGMLTAMAGLTQGVAKSITPVPISFAWSDGPQWVLNALDWIKTDWETRKLGLDPTLAPLGVLSMSFTYGYSQENDPVGFLTSIKLNDLVELGLLPVAATGNTGSPVHQWPARFADPTALELVDSLIAVSSVGNTGYKSSFSDWSTYVQVSAPGEDVTYPWWNAGVQDFKTGSGTSASCAKTAGLAAYLIGLSSKKTVYTNTQAVTNDIVNLAWTRGDKPAIYNGVVLTG